MSYAGDTRNVLMKPFVSASLCPRSHSFVRITCCMDIIIASSDPLYWQITPNTKTRSSNTSRPKIGCDRARIYTCPENVGYWIKGQCSNWLSEPIQGHRYWCDGHIWRIGHLIVMIRSSDKQLKFPNYGCQANGCGMFSQSSRALHHLEVLY